MSGGDHRVPACGDPVCVHYQNGTFDDGFAGCAGRAGDADSAAAVGIVLKLVAASDLRRPTVARDRAILTLIRCALVGDGAAYVVLRHALDRHKSQSKGRAARLDGGGA